MEQREAQELNYDFSYNMFLTKRLLSNNIPREQKESAVGWLRKLSLAKKSIREMQVRNEFLYHLLLQAQEGELKAPFNAPPPKLPLMELRGMLPSDGEPQISEAGKWADTGRGRDGKPMVYGYSPDGGAFLAAQPMPRSGVFCYVAVVSTKLNN